MTNCRSIVARVALALTIMIPAPALAQQLPPVAFSAVYIFGDSLADTGNDWLLTKAAGMTPAIPPSESPNRTYYRGRFSNGPIVFEYLCKRVQACGTPNVRPLLAPAFPLIPQQGGVSMAFGGTGSGYLTETPGGFQAPGVLGQVELFRVALLGKRPPANALYTIFTGSNDYPVEPGRTIMEPAAVVANIERAIRALYALGARNILVVNLPSPQIFPVFTLGLVEPQLGAELVARTVMHNQLLAGRIAVVKHDLPKLNLIDVNADLALQSVLATFSPVPPATFFFPSPDPNVPVFVCLVSGHPELCPDVPTFSGGGQMFWDAVHPTTEADSAFADYLYGALQRHYAH